jgi:ABC-type dipeptide/oligopeptide/nickel transport system ATPase subunit
VQNIVVNLECKMGDSFRCQKAADSVNLDPSQKDKHSLSIATDGFGEYNIGVILGSSGSGKTTLAKKIFGDGFEASVLDMSKAIIDQFPESMAYDDCVSALTGMGLTSIPCWIRPAFTLSNGQRARAEAALRLAMAPVGQAVVIDEWTSVVDRSTAKVMSHRIQKEARRSGKKVILLSCHYDVIDWINPDFIVDCNTQSYENRKAIGEVEAHKRQDTLRLELRACRKESWSLFSKYHYLSANLAPDTKFTFGLFLGREQVAFCAFTRYAFKNMKMLHSNRVVVHPDYVGLGLGIKMVDECSEYLSSLGFTVRAKFTSRAMLKARLKNPRWKLIKKDQVTSKTQNAVGLGMETAGKKISATQTAARNGAKLYYVTYFTFSYVPRAARTF